MLLAIRTGLEPATTCVTGKYSNQLNYRISETVSYCFRIAKLGAFLKLPNIFAKKISVFLRLRFYYFIISNLNNYKIAFNFSTNCSFGTTPTTLSTTFPSLKNKIVGILRIPYSAATS